MITSMAILTIVILVLIYAETDVTTIKVSKSGFSMHYQIKGGKVLDAKINLESKSLIIFIETASDGELKATIPRALIDAKVGNNDDSFFVIVDGEEVHYEENRAGQYRTLTIPFVNGNAEIEIIGTDLS